MEEENKKEKGSEDLKDKAEVKKEEISEDKEISKEDTTKKPLGVLDKDKETSLDDLLNDESKKNVSKKQNSQVKWAVILMVAVIIIVFLVPFIANELNKFEYIGLEFQKTKLGDIFFYSTKFPVVNIQGAIIGDYSINFRSDPRELEYIKVDIPDKTIKFMKNQRGEYNPVYLAIDPNMETCGDSVIAMANLAGFLGNSGLKVKSAVINETYAEENGFQYANCLSNPAETVIRIKSGNETIIYQVMKNCYNIEFKDCEIIPVSEKFTLTILEEYMSHFRNVGSDEKVIKEDDEDSSFFNIDLEEENAEPDTEEVQEEKLGDLLEADSII